MINNNKHNKNSNTLSQYWKNEVFFQNLCCYSQCLCSSHPKRRRGMLAVRVWQRKAVKIFLQLKMWKFRLKKKWKKVRLQLSVARTDLVASTCEVGKRKRLDVLFAVWLTMYSWNCRKLNLRIRVGYSSCLLLSTHLSICLSFPPFLHHLPIHPCIKSVVRSHMKERVGWLCKGERCGRVSRGEWHACPCPSCHSHLSLKSLCHQAGGRRLLSDEAQESLNVFRIKDLLASLWEWWGAWAGSNLVLVQHPSPSRLMDHLLKGECFWWN